jgi:hypothetical protein
MDELPPRARQVLREARGEAARPDHDARRRVREGVAKAVAANALVGHRGDARPPLPRAAFPSSVLGKLAAGTFLFALAGAGVALRQRSLPAQQSPAASTATEPPVSPSSGSAAGADSGSSVQAGAAPLVYEHVVPAAPPQRPAVRARGADTRAPSSSRDTLDSELALLRQVDAALLRRDGDEAQRLLAQHRARFPRPALLEEWRGFRVISRCLVDGPRAFASARAFAARYPHSVLTTRVRAACQQADEK